MYLNEEADTRPAFKHQGHYRQGTHKKVAGGRERNVSNSHYMTCINSYEPSEMQKDTERKHKNLTMDLKDEI